MWKKILVIACCAAAVAAIVLGIVFLTRPNDPESETVSLSLSSSEADVPPDGWQVVSYEGTYSAAFSSDGVVTLTAADADDLRLVYDYPVEGGARYVLTAEVKTVDVAGARGAGLSIDNYAIDQSCVYSTRQVLGTSDWVTVQLGFVTAKKTSTARIALRIGGYGEAASGSASFRNVTLSTAEDPDVVYQTLTAWTSSSVSADSDTTSAKHAEYLKSFFSIIVWAAVLCFVVLYFGVYRSYDRICTVTQLKKRRILLVFWGAVAVGFLIRFVLCQLYKGHDSDLGCWISWGSDIANNGTAQFYTAAGHEWYDYPPGYMLILAGMSKMMGVLGIGSYTPVGMFCYMIPPFVADILCGLLLLRFCRERGMPDGAALTLSVLVVLNPAAVFLSGAWSQIDSILTLLLLLTFYQLGSGRRIAAGLIYGFAILIKWQALIFGPVLAIAFLLNMRSWKDLLHTVLAVAGALLVVFLGGLPFQGDQPWYWLVTKFMSASSGYDYATIEAYNYMALCGGNWVSAQTSIYGGALTYKGFGTLAIVVAVLLGGGVLALEERRIRRAGLPPSEHHGALYLAAALCMAVIFTFGHYMHERYVFPVLFLLLFAFAWYRDRRLLLVFVIFTTTTFLNEMSAMYVISNLASAVVRGQREHTELLRFFSAVETLGCLYFVWVCLDMLLHVKDKLRAGLPRLVGPDGEEETGDEQENG